MREKLQHDQIQIMVKEAIEDTLKHNGFENFDVSISFSKAVITLLIGHSMYSTFFLFSRSNITREAVVGHVQMWLMDLT